MAGTVVETIKAMKRIDRTRTIKVLVTCAKLRQNVTRFAKGTSNELPEKRQLFRLLALCPKGA